MDLCIQRIDSVNHDELRSQGLESSVSYKCCLIHYACSRHAFHRCGVVGPWNDWLSLNKSLILSLLYHRIPNLIKCAFVALETVEASVCRQGDGAHEHGRAGFPDTDAQGQPGKRAGERRSTAEAKETRV